MPASTLPRSAADRSDASPARSHAPRVARAARRSRSRAWLAFLLVLVALRLVRPFVLGPVAEDTLSRLLGAQVTVGDVSFAPIDGVVTLRDVTVRTGGDPAATPPIGAARVRLDLQWLPLLHRALVVRELALESATIDVERLARRDASLAHVLRADPASELPAGWTFALDRVALRDTRLRVPEPAPGGPPLDVRVRDAQVATRQRRASAFRRAPNLHVDALVEGSRLRVDGSSDLRDEGVVIDAVVRAKDVPLRRLHPYLADLGWTAVDGRLSGRFHYQREPGRRDLLAGRARARGVAVHVAGVEPPALAVRSAEAEVDAIDLRSRRVAIRSLMLHGPRLVLRGDLESPVPLLAGARPATPARPARRPAPGASVAPEPAWTWAVRRVETRAGELQIAGAGAPDDAVVLGAALSGENLGPRAYWSPLRVWVAGDAGAAEFDGSVRVKDGVRIGGRLTARDVDAPAMARAFGLPLAALAQAGRGSAALDVEIDPAATDAPTLGLRGEIAVDDVWLAGPEPGAFAVGARAVRLTLAGVAPAQGDRSGTRPPEVRFADATVTQPYVLLTRTATGWELPPFAVADAGDAGVVGAPPTHPAPAPAPVRTAAAPADPTAAPAPAIVLARVQASGGRLLVVDRAVRPDVVLDVDVHGGWAADVRWPDVGQFALQGAGRPFGEVQAVGSATAGRTDVEVALPSFALAAATPYLADAGLPYWFDGGTGSLASQVALVGPRWMADTSLTLRDPQVGGDQGALERALGMRIENARAALRDLAGDVTLELALGSPHDRSAPTVDGMVTAALREAVVRAGRAPRFDGPLRIAFAHGGGKLDGDATRQLGAVAELLAARPEAIVELTSRLSRDDRRALAEQAAGVHLVTPGPFVGMLRAFGVRDQHTRIRDALAARAAGDFGRLDARDEAVLADLVAAAPPIDDYRLAALAAERANRVADVLRERYDVPPSRIVVKAADTAEAPGPPIVRVDVAVRPRDPLVHLAGEPW